jgi:hypothetical protein
MKNWLGALLVLLGGNAAAASEVVLFRDGTRMEARSVELGDGVAVITAMDGKLLSVPREHIVSDPASIVDIRGWAREMARSVHRAAESYGAFAPRDPASALVTDALTRGFAEDRLAEEAARAFAERSNDLVWAEILPWLHSPLVQKMERLERAELPASPPGGATPVRLELLERLDRATGTSDIALELQAAMTASIVDGVNASLPVAHQRAEGELTFALDRVRASLEPETRERILSSFLHTYRDVSDEELREYVEFLESDNGLALSQAILESLYVAIEDSSRRTSSIVASRARTLGKTRI